MACDIYAAFFGMGNSDGGYTNCGFHAVCRTIDFWGPTICRNSVAYTEGGTFGGRVNRNSNYFSGSSKVKGTAFFGWRGYMVGFLAGSRSW